MPYPLICSQCGTEFDSKNMNQKFCSIRCKGEFFKSDKYVGNKGGVKPKYEAVTKTCEVCGQPFLCRLRYDVLFKKFCSRDCYKAAKSRFAPRVGRIERACGWCGKPMHILPCHEETKHFCSKRCSAAATHRGSDNGQWAGGNAEYWKRQARERDNHKCQVPYCTYDGPSKGLHAHHMVPLACGGTNDLSNLVTLCNEHHRGLEYEVLKRLAAKFPGVFQEVAKEVFSFFPPEPQK